jgi:hypothetical protein
MTREEYEERRRRLDAELRAGIELLEQGHRAQVRALDLVWSAQGDPPLSAPPPQRAAPPSPPAVAPAPPPKRRRRGPGEISDAVDAILDELPPVFTKDDICRALGETPDRRALHRVLRDLQQNGTVELESFGQGRTPASYRRLPRSGSS